MPVSALHHKVITGHYQHKPGIKSGKTNAPATDPNEESYTLTDEIREFLPLASRVINSAEACSCQQGGGRQNAVGFFLRMMLAQHFFQPVDCIRPLLHTPFMSQEGGTMAFTGAGQSGGNDSADSVLSTELPAKMPYLNRQPVSWYDPLSFPQAAASTLPKNVTEWEEMYEIGDSSFNRQLFNVLAGRNILHDADDKHFLPVMFLFPRSEAAMRGKRESFSAHQQHDAMAFQRYASDNCHIKTKNNHGMAIGDSLLVTGDMIRNPVRAVVEKVYGAGKNGNKVPSWLTEGTEGANIGMNITLGFATYGLYPLIKYASAKALSASGHLVNKDIGCLKMEFSAAGMASLLLDTEVGVTNRHMSSLKGYQAKPRGSKFTRVFEPDGSFVHENTGNMLNTVKNIAFSHNGARYFIKERVRGEYRAFKLNEMNPDSTGRKVYFNAVTNKIHFESNMVKEHGMDYDVLDGEIFVRINGVNQEVSWDWKNNRPQTALRKPNGDPLNVPVYMDPLSKTWHMSMEKGRYLFKGKERVICELGVKREKGDIYLEKNNANEKYYGEAKIYHPKILVGKDRHPRGAEYIEIKGELVGVRKNKVSGDDILYEAYNVNKPSDAGYPVEWDGSRWVFERRTSVHVSRDLRKKITPDMYNKNIDEMSLSAPDSMGLRTGASGRKYIKVKGAMCTIMKKGGVFYIKGNKGSLPLIYRSGKFYSESLLRRLSRIKNQGLSGRNIKPYRLIANKLKINEESARELLSGYQFPEGSNLYNENTFALWIKDSAHIPDWAESFKFLDFSSYTSPFKNQQQLENKLLRFTGGDGYLYRVDRTPPETIMKSGFRASEDYTAISKMIPENAAGLIVAGNLEGALRYNSLAKSPYIYKIDIKNIRGVSLRDNLMTNQKGVTSFLGEPSQKHYATLDAFAQDCDGAIYLDEVHLYHQDISTKDISLFKVEEDLLKVLDGPWRNYFR